MKQEAGQFPSSCVHEVAESKGFRALEEYLERVCTYAVCVVRCCVLGEITLNVRCPQLSDSRFGVYCHSKATSQIYVPLTNITHPLGHSFGYLTDVNSVTRGNTFLVHIS